MWSGTNFGGVQVGREVAVGAVADDGPHRGASQSKRYLFHPDSLISMAQNPVQVDLLVRDGR